MKLMLRRVLTLSLAAAFCASGYAAEDDDIPVEYLRQLDNSISIGLRMRSTGPKVKFGNLGTVPNTTAAIGEESSSRTRIYNNGYVELDAVRTNEKDSNGNQIGSGGRYQVSAADTSDLDGDGDTAESIVVGDYVSYVAGQTRSWGYNNANQYNSTTGRIAMSAYWATSTGISTEAQGESEGGFELQFEHSFGKIGKRFEWGVVASIGLTDINVKKSERIAARLHTITDYYSFADIPPSTIPTGGPTFEDLYLPSTTTLVTSGGYETTTRLNDRPDYRAEYSDGVALVDGTWQVKGAYYIVHCGPSVRFNFTEHFAVSASAGFAGGYVGTKFLVNERIINTDVSGTIFIEEENETRNFVAGYFANVNVEYWVTQRTGFYAGVNYESMGDFTQDTLRGRTATIDLGSGAGFRFGITTKF